MALYFDLPVYKDGYDLLLKLFTVTKTLPREYKFSSGEKLKQEALDLLICIYQATKQSGDAKSNSIERARSHLEIIRLMTRVMKDLGIWSVATVVGVNIKIESISKQLSQWAIHTARVQE